MTAAGQIAKAPPPADDAAHVMLLAMAPRAVFVLGKRSGIVLVANFHVIHPGGEAGLIDRADLFVGIDDEDPLAGQRLPPFATALRATANWIGVSGFLISCAMRRATSAQAALR